MAQRLLAGAVSLVILVFAAAVIGTSGRDGSAVAYEGSVPRYAATGATGNGPVSSNPTYEPPPEEDGPDNTWTWNSDVTYDNDTHNTDDRDVTYDNDTTIDNSDHSTVDDHSVTNVDDHSTTTYDNDTSIVGDDNSGNHQDNNHNTNSNQNQQNGGVTDNSGCEGGTEAPLGFDVTSTETGVSVGIWAPVTVVVCDIYVLSGNNVNVGDTVDVNDNSVQIIETP